ncbi:MAG: copper amine oxidase N-terminal domain-containing protein [Defluviitaleaceae bacterium]|nr:copper amine oxidase N-terminal domain-containing protein [Defluviitaleaceae bacterium]
MEQDAYGFLFLGYGKGLVPFIYRDRTFLPIYSVGSVMGYDAAWEGELRLARFTRGSPLARALPEIGHMLIRELDIGEIEWR